MNQWVEEGNDKLLESIGFSYVKNEDVYYKIVPIYGNHYLFIQVEKHLDEFIVDTECHIFKEAGLPTFNDLIDKLSIASIIDADWDGYYSDVESVVDTLEETVIPLKLGRMIYMYRATDNDPVIDDFVICDTDILIVDQESPIDEIEIRLV